MLDIEPDLLTLSGPQTGSRSIRTSINRLEGEGGPARQKSEPSKGGDHAQLADVGKRQNVEGPGEEDDSDHERVGRNS